MNTKYMNICFSVVALTGATCCMGDNLTDYKQNNYKLANQVMSQLDKLQDTKNQNLLTAAGSGNYQQVIDALNAGPNVNATDGQGWTALMLAAAKNDNHRIVEALIAAKANVNAHDTKGNTPLLLAIHSGREVSAIDLSNNGASICNLSTTDKATLQIWRKKDRLAPLVESCNSTNANKPTFKMGGGAGVD